MAINFIPVGLTLIQAGALRLISPTLFMPRNMGGFVADVTIEEDSEDEMMITEHPVERGAAITDHSYVRPSRVTIKAGWSNSSFSALGNPFYVQAVYAALLQLQKTRQPFDIVTGKRAYTNMLFRRLSVKTDEKSENALDLTAQCQEIIIASTQTVSTPEAKNMANPQSDAGVSNRGSVSATTNPGNFNAAAAPATRFDPQTSAL